MSYHQTIQLEPTRLVRLNKLAAASEGRDAILAGYHGKAPPLCLCRPHGVPIHIRKIAEHYHLARNPNTGPLHTPACTFFEYHPLYSGRPDDWHITEACRPRMIAHALWEEAQLNNWHPGMLTPQGKSKRPVRKALALLAAAVPSAFPLQAAVHASDRLGFGFGVGSTRWTFEWLCSAAQPVPPHLEESIYEQFKWTGSFPTHQIWRLCRWNLRGHRTGQYLFCTNFGMIPVSNPIESLLVNNLTRENRSFVRPLWFDVHKAHLPTIVLLDSPKLEAICISGYQNEQAIQSRAGDFGCQLTWFSGKPQSRPTTQKGSGS